MRLLRGEEKLGEFKGVPLIVDWSYLNQEVGLRKEEEKFEYALGRLLTWVVIFSWILMAIYTFMQGDLFFINIHFVDDLYKLGFWLSILPLLYSYYLKRNRDLYLDRLKTKELTSLWNDLSSKKKINELEVTTYFDHDMLNLIDDVLGEFHDNFVPELLVALLEYSLVQQALFRLGLDIEKFKEVINKSQSYQVHIKELIRPLLIKSFLIAFTNRFAHVDELALFLFLVQGPLKQVLLDYEIGEKEIHSLELWAKNEADKRRYIKIFKERSSLKPTSIVNRSFTSSYSPTLMKYSRDFTAEVVNGDFTMSIAREKELNLLIAQLQEGSASAVIVLGAPGVGKTTLLKSLAVRMVVEEVPEQLKDMRLVSFDFNRAFALASSLDDFKGIMEKALEETAKTKNIILVIDDLDELVNIRREYSAEVVSLITKAVDNYKLRLVATASLEGYSRHIKPFKSLTSTFDTVTLEEPTDEVAVQMLMDILPSLEQEYGIKVAFQTLVKTVKLSRKFAFERVLPDKGIDLIEEAMVKAQEKGLTFINESIVEEIVSQKVGVNVGQIEDAEAELLVNLEENLHKRIVGQDEAVKAVAAALRRARAGLTSGERPIASFMFFGPTGVGKTELAKAVTQTFYGDKKLMIRVDMSEYQEEENLKRLIGHPDSGEYEGGYLTESVRIRPFSLILLDEIEKANPKVLDLFLQVLDEGSITDGFGRKVDFTNTILIATSNVASSQIADLISEGKKYKEVYAKVLPQIRKFLRVEFINRFDRVIMFKPLLKVEVEEIAGLLMLVEKDKLSEKGIHLEYSAATLRQLAELGYNPLYGARELRRVIQDNIEDKIAELIITKKVKSGGEIVFNSLDDIETK